MLSQWHFVRLIVFHLEMLVFLFSFRELFHGMKGRRCHQFHVMNVAAAAKSLQSCLTLCDPIDGSPPGSPVPRILRARTPEWVAISFSNAFRTGHLLLSNVSCIGRQVLYPLQWHPTPVLFPGKSHGWRSLECCSPWGR